MSEAVRVYVSRRPPLQTVISHRSRRFQSLLHIPGFEKVALLCGVRPHSCETIRLQFQSYGNRLRRLRIPFLRRARFAFNPQQFLDVMPDFMCQDISFRKLSGRSESALEFVVKT